MESNNRFNLSQRFVMVSAVAALGRNHANSASQVKRMLAIRANWRERIIESQYQNGKYKIVGNRGTVIIMGIDKMNICSMFPIELDEYYISVLTVEDIAERSRWPSYEGYHKGFNLILKDEEALFRKYSAYSNENSLSFTVKHNDAVIGFFSFNQIDWKLEEVANTTIRIHPFYCNNGIGKKIMNALCEKLLDNGIKAIKLDVHSKNNIAEKCYKSCGFKFVKSIIRDNEEFYYMEKRSG